MCERLPSLNLPQNISVLHVYTYIHICTQIKHTHTEISYRRKTHNCCHDEQWRFGTVDESNTLLNATRVGRIFSPSRPRENANTQTTSTDSMGNWDKKWKLSEVTWFMFKDDLSKTTEVVTKEETKNSSSPFS